MWISLSFSRSCVCVRTKAKLTRVHCAPLPSRWTQRMGPLSLSLSLDPWWKKRHGERERKRESVWERLRDGQMTQKGDENERNAHCDRTHLILSSLFHPNVVGVTSREGGVTGIIKTSDTPTSTRTLRHAWTHGGRCLQLWPFGLHWAE